MRALARLCPGALLLLLALTWGGTVALAAPSGPAFSLRPVRYDTARPETRGYFILAAAPDQQVRDEVLVRNSGDAAGVVRLYAVDGQTAATSGAAFPNEGDPRQAVGTWITLAEHEFALGPGEERTVPFTVTIPVDAVGGQHLGGIVAANPVVTPGTAVGGFQVNVQNRAVTAVQVDLPGAVVERVAVTGVATGGRQARQNLVLGLRNDGNQLVKPTGTLSVTDAQGRAVQLLPLQLDTFLPDTAIHYPVAVQRQALGAGRYHARVDLTYGTSGVTHYEGDFDITAAEVAQVFPSAAPLAPPPVAAVAATPPATTGSTDPARWPLFVGGAALLVLALVGGLFLGRRGRPGDAAK